MTYRNLLIIATGLAFMASCTRIVDSDVPKTENWNSYQTEQYTFYVRPGSLAEDSIEAIKTEQEWAYREINRRLELSFDRKLQVYIYNSEEDMGATNRTGKAYPELATIEAIYSPEIKSIGARGVSLHELSHIAVFYGWCPTPQPLFAEGLAVWLDNYWNDPSVNSTSLFRVSRAHLRQGNLPDVERMMNQWNQMSATYSYPTAGSFAKYLIDQYGLDSYKALYCEARPDNFSSVFYDIYQTEIRTVEREYRSFLEDK
ncbi:MAG: hypothetical protein U5K69_15080 [Balneolaceae bacterium]|nr:hypothetical protein [Balneolaceae bacterium]